MPLSSSSSSSRPPPATRQSYGAMCLKRWHAPKSAFGFGVDVCRVSPDAPPYLVLYVRGDEGPVMAARYNTIETSKLLKWLSSCDINSVHRPACELVDTGRPGCWYQSHLGGGTSLCFSHNMDAEFLIVQGFRLTGSDSAAVIQHLLDLL